MSVTSLHKGSACAEALDVIDVIDGSPSVQLPVSYPSEAHTQETSLNISGYLNFALQQSYTPSSTPSTALTSTVASRKTSADNLTAVSTALSSGGSTHDLERFPLRISSALFAYLLCGWGDGVTGVVLPKFRQDLGISYTDSSLFFAAGTGGYFLGTLAIETIFSFLGRFDLSVYTWPFRAFQMPLAGPEMARSSVRYSPSKARARLLFLASILHALFFVTLGSEPKFPTGLVAFAVAAFARALLTGLLNDYVNSHPKRSLGQLHGFWAIGSFFSPLVCQSLMSKGVPWRNFYLGSLALSGLNTAFLAVAYAPTPSELSKDISRVEQTTNPGLPSAVSPQRPETRSTLRPALSIPLLWAFSIFAGIYCGSETATQGFIVVYLLSERNANPRTVGYVSSGFWAGMSISRIAVGFLYPRLSFRCVKLFLHLNLSLFVPAQFEHDLSFSPPPSPAPVIALVMHVLVWVVPSLAVDSLCTGIIGIVYGPIFPIGMALLTQLLPPELHMISMAIISTFGSIGNAIFPFVTGILLSDVSMKTYSYTLVTLGVCLVVLWGFLPSKTKRETLK